MTSPRASNLRIAALNTNRLWRRDCSLHNEFHGFENLLSQLNIDIAFLSELNAPDSPTTPPNSTFQYVGPSRSFGRDAGFLARRGLQLDAIRGVADRSNLVWRALPARPGHEAIAIASFWAPHVGCPEDERLAFWVMLHASIAAVRASLPSALLLIAGDSNLWVPGLVSCRPPRSQDSGALAQLNAILEEFSLCIANQRDSATHRAGAALDLVITSHGLLAAPPEVHNGQHCRCADTRLCCPALNSDHYLITAQLATTCRGSDCLHTRGLACWPHVSDWTTHLRTRAEAIGTWHQKVRHMLRSPPSPSRRRCSIDQLYVDLERIIWSGCEFRRRSCHRRAQPTWWDDSCYNAMVRRNAAWRDRRRDSSDETQAAYCDARRQFHRAVQRARSTFWEQWLGEVELMSASRPRAAARQCRRQFACAHNGPPLNMDWSAPVVSPPGPSASPDSAAREAWQQHFLHAGTSSGEAFDAAHASRIDRRVARLLGAHPENQQGLDDPFVAADLLRAFPHCEDSAVGPDGFPFQMFRVDLPWWHSAVSDFCSLLLQLGTVPSRWKEAHIVPVLKKGSRNQPSNYRPISLTSCFARLFERLVLSRIGPLLDEQLDPCQAGFRSGSDEQVYALQECLRLRGSSKTFCAFIDLKNAFGSCWVNAALWRLRRGGVHGLLWKVIADLCRGGVSRVKAYEGLSSAASDCGLGQGRVLSPILFNLVMNGAAAAVQRVCPGVRLGLDPRAPRVSTLLYADDLVILAESHEELQQALAALAEWARLWRFSFSPGVDKSAVMIFRGRHSGMTPFSLGVAELPFVDSYRYLGVIFDSRCKWSRHVRHVLARGQQKIAACVAWAEREKLNLAWRAKLFRAYVLDAFAFGSEFILEDHVALRAFNRHLVAFGRRLLGWPRGSPAAAVLGDLGWLDGEAIALQRASSLWARLDSHVPSLPHGSLAGKVFAFARTQATSWASVTFSSLSRAHVPFASSWGVGPGQPASLRRRWLHSAAFPALQASACGRFRDAIARLPSLLEYSHVQPSPHLDQAVHNRRVAFADARLWSLARCGHHCFGDGRVHRHRFGAARLTCPLCMSHDDNLAHALLACQGTADLRGVWLRRTCIQPAFAEPLSWSVLFRSSASLPSHVIWANVSYVAQVCRRRELCNS